MKLTLGNLTAVDPMHWAKRLKSEIALTYLLGGCAAEPRLEAILSKHIELENVIDMNGYWSLNPRAPRDAMGGLVNFD